MEGTMPTRTRGQKSAEETTTDEKPAAKPKKKSAAAADLTLPSMSEFENVEVPDFPRSFVRKQGGDKPPRKFSAKGPKADAVAKVIFANRGFTRTQISDIVDCSASRVTEIMWAIEDAHNDDSKWELPVIPRQKRKAAEDDAE